MPTDLLVLQICDFLDDGDGFYRLHEPSRCLSRLPGVTVVDSHFYHQRLPALVELADVVVLPFLHDWDLFSDIDHRRASGRVTVFEANDYFYDVQPWSPIAQQWQDRAIQEEYRHFLSFADGVQTSTRPLARHWEPLARRVAVFANQLSEIPPLAPPPDRPLTIGWGGSPSHFADWYEIAPVVQRWLDAHPDVHLAVMTHEFAKPFIRLAPERYHFTPFGTLASFLKFLPNIDIGLAPLLPTGYNRGRSDVKHLEYAAHGVVGIYADLEPYRETVRHGETGLIYRNREELVQCLDRLAADADFRLRLRKQAHDYVSRERRVMDHIGERLDFYKSLLPDSPRSRPAFEPLLAGANQDGNYYQLRPGPVEKSLLAALEKKPAEAVPSLALLLQQHPDYLPALYNLGRLLNDGRDFANAERYLEHARRLKPRSARVVSELARARFGVDDIVGARAHLEAALEINPRYYPGWQYLLRLFGLHLILDGPRWAERGRELFPASYSLAILGAFAYPPAERLPLLAQLLESYAPTLKPEEINDAADTFGQALLALSGTALTSAAGQSLVCKACAIFPKSLRLASLAAQVLHDAGQEAESHRFGAHAMELHRAGTLHRREYTKEDGTIHLWQFAEHIRKWRGLD